jgi:putative phage-type endonuclease
MAAPILLCDTKGMTRERWLDCRMHGPKGDIKYTVGGSDVATIFGLSPWTTPLELWRIKKGLMKPSISANADQLEMGHLLEPIIAHWYAKKTGYTVTEDTGLYQHANFPYALANIDRRFEEPSGAKGVLECKSTTYHKASDWAECVIPVYYEMQIRFYLAVMDVEIGDFACHALHTHTFRFYSAI